MKPIIRHLQGLWKSSSLINSKGGNTCSSQVIRRVQVPSLSLRFFICSPCSHGVGGKRVFLLVRFCHPTQEDWMIKRGSIWHLNQNVVTKNTFCPTRQPYLTHGLYVVFRPLRTQSRRGNVPGSPSISLISSFL